MLSINHALAMVRAIHVKTLWWDLRYREHWWKRQTLSFDWDSLVLWAKRKQGFEILILAHRSREEIPLLLSGLPLSNAFLRRQHERDPLFAMLEKQRRTLVTSAHGLAYHFSPNNHSSSGLVQVLSLDNISGYCSDGCQLLARCLPSVRARAIESSTVHSQSRISKGHVSSTGILWCIPGLTCKLLGLAGDTEYPLSLVDEILPEGLVRLSLLLVTNRSVLSFLLVPLATAVAPPPAAEAVVAAGGEARLLSSWPRQSSSNTHWARATPKTFPLAFASRKEIEPCRDAGE